MNIIIVIIIIRIMVNFIISNIITNKVIYITHMLIIIIIITMHYLLVIIKDSKVTLLDWPPYSPDLNLIENFWAILSQEIYG